MQRVKELVEKGVELNPVVKEFNGESADMPWTELRFIKTTPLDQAVLNGNIDIIKYLLSKGANPNASLATNDDIYKNPSKHMGGLNGVVSHVDNGNFQGDSNVLSHAIDKGDLQIIKILLDAKANPNIRNRHGETPIMHAAANGRLEIIKLLEQDYKANTAGAGEAV